MSTRYRRDNRVLVRCDLCPGQPVLPTPCEIDTRRCVRCQGEGRVLPVPHPEDHLCAMCRTECPGCAAPTGDPEGGPCRSCRGQCRSCRSPLPDRRPAETVRKEAPVRTDATGRRWARVYPPRSHHQDLCEDCRHAAGAADPVRAVLASLPDKVVRACGGSAPPAVVRTIRAELRHHTAPQLAGRIERRWWNGWADRPLRREEDGPQAAYRPDDVALWLVAPGGCPARCDDGWAPGDPDRRCPHCAAPPGEAIAGRAASAPGTDRTAAQAIAHRPPMRECEGGDGSCGVPVAAPRTRCPSCANWPRCACGSRYDPDLGSACGVCGPGRPDR